MTNQTKLPINLDQDRVATDNTDAFCKRWRIIEGEVLTVAQSDELSSLGPFDALFCDPPYGIEFMGAAWDHGVPSTEVWHALGEHIRPGASIAAFGGTRTWHRLAVNMEDADMEMRDSIMAWMYGSGWPKPGNVSKMIDRRLGAERKVVGTNPNGRMSRVGSSHQSTGEQTAGLDVTAPATEAAQRFDGWHANLGPAWEPTLLFRKPLDGGLAGNALAHGVGGLWIDGARLPTSENLGRPQQSGDKMQRIRTGEPTKCDVYSPGSPLGRWPKNAVLCCEESICGDVDRDGEHAPGCPVYEVGKQSGFTRSSDRVRRVTAAAHNASPVFGSSAADFVTGGHKDAGTAARFFYVAKVSRRERSGIPHPCMKPIALCRQIATLLLPPPRADGLPRRLLVPYSGSGSEMIGALQAGWDEVIGIEIDPNWACAARKRITETVG